MIHRQLKTATITVSHLAVAHAPPVTFPSSSPIHCALLVLSRRTMQCNIVDYGLSVQSTHSNHSFMNQPRANPEEIQETFSEIDMNKNPQAIEGEYKTTSSSLKRYSVFFPTNEMKE